MRPIHWSEWTRYLATNSSSWVRTRHLLCLTGSIASGDVGLMMKPEFNSTRMLSKINGTWAPIDLTQRFSIKQSPIAVENILINSVKMANCKWANQLRFFLGNSGRQFWRKACYLFLQLNWPVPSCFTLHTTFVHLGSNVPVRRFNHRLIGLWHL